jgi:hypothetical protein
MHGTCTECGLEFEWAYVLHPEKFEPRWCVEFAPAMRLPRSCAATFVRSLWPPGFWRRHNMAHALRRRRLLIYIVFLLLVFSLLYVAVQATAAVSVRWLVEQQLIEYRKMLPSTLASMRRIMDGNSRDPETLKAAGWSDEQIEASLKYYEAEIARLQAAINAPVVVNQSYLNAICEAVVFPRSAFSNGTVQDPTGWYGTAYPAPIELYGVLQNAAVGGPVPAMDDIAIDLLATAVAFYGVGIVGLPVLPLTMALLPVSRRRARVRWPHILRVFLYSLFIPVFFAYAVLGGIVVSLMLAGQQGPFLTFIIGAVGPWAGIVVWWAAAIRHYLRMPHALPVAFLLAVLSFLLLVAVIGFGVALISALYDLLV